MAIRKFQLYPVVKHGEKRIWACLLTNEGYLRGVLTLYYSLVKSRTKFPFYVIYTEVRYSVDKMLTVDIGTESAGCSERAGYTDTGNPLSSSWNDLFSYRVPIQRDLVKNTYLCPGAI